MDNKHKFVKYHWTQVISLGILAVLVVAWQVILEETNLGVLREHGVVKGEAIQENEAGEQNQTDQLILNYQNEVKNIVQNYLRQRIEFEKPHQDWLFLINKTKYKLLSLSVPEEYKELQTRLVTTLDVELATISGASSFDLKQINDRWQKILDQYFWLNK